MIDKFAEAIKNADLIDPHKCVAGFQVVPNEIPGFGHIEFNQVTISMRVAPRMEKN